MTFKRKMYATCFQIFLMETMVNAKGYSGKVQSIVTDVNKGSLSGVKVILINEGARVEVTRISDSN